MRIDISDSSGKHNSRIGGVTLLSLALAVFLFGQILAVFHDSAGHDHGPHEGEVPAVECGLCFIASHQLLDITPALDFSSLELSKFASKSITLFSAKSIRVVTGNLTRGPPVLI